MIVRQRASLVVVGAFLIALALTGSASAQCNSDFVTVQAKFITVVPTGGDNTENLQCAFDLGATMGPGVTVRLAAGTFTTEQLVIRNFRGSITGMGQGITILHNPAYPLPIARTCYDPGACFADEPPSPTNPYPSLVTLLGTDVTLSDLSIVIAGGFGTEMWLQPWPNAANTEILSNALQVMGSGGSYRFERLSIDGGACCSVNAERNSFTGDASSAAIVWNWWQPPLLTNASVAIANSALRGASALLLYNLDQTRVFLRDNRFEANGGGILLSDLHQTVVMAEGNEVVGFAPGTRANNGVNVYTGMGPGIIDSSLWFANNRFFTKTGLNLGAFVNVKCEAVNNDVSATDTPYKLNNVTCKVVGQR